MEDKKALADLLMSAQTTARNYDFSTTREEFEFIAEALIANGVVVASKKYVDSDVLQTANTFLVSDLNHIAGVLEGLSYCVPDNVSEGLCNQAEIIDGILGRSSILPEVDDGKIK